MSRFEVPIAIVLIVSIVGSLVAFFLSRTSDGKVRLNAHTEDNAGDCDPFDIIKAEDVIDGYPVDSESFWNWMRWRKSLVSFCLALALAMSAMLLGWSIVNNGHPQASFYAVHVAFNLYIFLISACSVSQSSTEYHSESMLHLTVLLTISLLSSGIGLLPQPPSFPSVHSEGDIDETFTRALRYILLTIYAATCVISYTTPLGPPLHYPPSDIYSTQILRFKTNVDGANVCGANNSSPLAILLFSYTSKVVWMGTRVSNFEIGDLPILPANMRAVLNYSRMKKAMHDKTLRIFSWTPTPGSGWQLAYHILCANRLVLGIELGFSFIIPFVPYIPPIFLRKFVALLEVDLGRERKKWAWIYVIGLFSGQVFTFLMNVQFFSLATTVQTRLKIQLNSVLYAKTLVRKDVVSLAPNVPSAGAELGSENGHRTENKAVMKQESGEFSSKAQIMTLMTTDVDRAAGLHVFQLITACVETIVAMVFLYDLLGVSCFAGLAVICFFLPINHYSGTNVIGAQEKLMKARDERMSLTNEMLGAIRMIKFMAWERSFEKRIQTIRDRELKYQRLNYAIATAWNALWNGIPILVIIASFWHFTVFRGQALTPSIAFTSILVFAEMRFALGTLPEVIIKLLQGFVSMRRIEKYLNSEEVDPVPPLVRQSKVVAFQSCTVSWPTATSSTLNNRFCLADLSLKFPQGALSLVCGKLGSGKTLLLSALMGEADVISGQVLCPRSPPESMASFANIKVRKEDWVVSGICAYVPQTAWLLNASIKDNILFNLPYDDDRYRKTLEVCALVTDLENLEDGDESEVGERGVNLSGGQKARISLARAVYSRASIILLDDVLSAVDAHTAQHLYQECFRGELMLGRTVILVSHQIQLCAPTASYIVVLDSGHVQFAGSKDEFYHSNISSPLVHSNQPAPGIDQEEKETLEAVEERVLSEVKLSAGETSTTTSVVITAGKEERIPRKLVEDEKHAAGHISRDVWETYIWACGSTWYWLLFAVIFVAASASPVVEKGWLGYWSNSAPNDGGPNTTFFITVYAAITLTGLLMSTIQPFILYAGSIRASNLLYKRFLESILFAEIRFHDTISRGRLLNRFGKDFEGIDSQLSDGLGRTIMNVLSAFSAFLTISYIGGPFFILVASTLALVYWNVAKIYGPTSRETRRLNSVTHSPIYTIYGDTISGVTIVRAFGASSYFLRDMLRRIDTNTNPFYWMWGVTRWLSVRSNLLSAGLVGITGFVCVINPNITASMAGIALVFASSITDNFLQMVRRFTGLEQSLVALERVKEYNSIRRESAEFVDPRPSASWPSGGVIKCENLTVRYAPELPDVLHALNFEINPGEKVGIIGRTGSGKSTLAMSFFRFVEPIGGRIEIDGIDISKIGLTDLRSRLTVIPQDPTILSGTLRSVLDVANKYQDAEIYQALRRVHLIPAEGNITESDDTVNANVFQDLDSKVSEGGDNFSTGERQLLCMARAILKRSRILIMDEATASVDYATDELIGKTIRQEFATSTILTIAHRLRTIIDYDRVMLLEQGRIIEFDRPVVLLNDPSSKFYALCKATGPEEFAVLEKMSEK